MASLQQLEQALVKADKAGDMNSARKLAAVIKRERSRLAETPSEEVISQIPGMEQSTVPVPETIPTEKSYSLPELAIGAGEAGASTATGMTSGAAMGLGGFLNALAKEIVTGHYGSQEAASRIQEATMRAMEAGTYTPRTEAGQMEAEAVGKGFEAITPVLPMAAELAPVGEAASMAARRAIPAIKEGAPAIPKVVGKVKEALPFRKPKPVEEVSGPKSAGAAQVAEGTLRQGKADELPVPIRLTKGQKTGEFKQQQFERETAKLAEAGEPIRKRFAEQRTQLEQNLDAFIDKTGSKASDLRGIGESVDAALKKRMARDKTRMRVIRKEAAKAGEMDSPVNISSVGAYLNKNRARRLSEGIMEKVQRQLDVIGAAEGNFKEGTLKIKPMTVNQAEDLRVFINENTNWMEPREIPISAKLKQLIDNNTEGAGADLYKQYRNLRIQFANDYENIGLIKQLLNTKKGTNDRAIALEDVLDRSVLRPSTSLDTVRQLKRLLESSDPLGSKGRQAWREIKGGTIAYIKDMVLKSVQKDSAGNRVVSPSQLDKVITSLDKSGKLDLILGKKGASQLRLLNEVAQDILVAPTGAVNMSNTASAIANILDQIPLGKFTGTTVKKLFSFIKDRELRAKVKEALGD